MQSKACFVILAALLVIPACSGEEGGGSTRRGEAPARMEKADSVRTRPVEIALVFSEKTIWKSSECSALEEPTGYYRATFDSLFIIKNNNNIIAHEGLGHLEIEPGPPESGPPEYFSCTLEPWIRGSE